MDGVAAEVAQEVGMLLKHHDIDAGAEQKPTHHAGRAATRNHAGGCDGLGHHGSFLGYPDPVIPAQAGIQRAKRQVKTGYRLSPV
jgi:hypothetical protein